MNRLAAIQSGVLTGRASMAVMIVIVVFSAMTTFISWGILLFLISVAINHELFKISALRWGSDRTLKEEALLFATCLVVATMLSSFLILRQQPDGFAICLQLVWSVFAFDTVALVSGKVTSQFWETHKIAPGISPGKSWEGYACGLVAGVCSLGVSGALLLQFGVQPALTLYQHGWMVVLALTFGHMGDFAKSAFKRWAGVKDSGTLLGGHGGVLDRFDAFTCVGLAGLVMLLAGVI